MTTSGETTTPANRRASVSTDYALIRLTASTNYALYPLS